jgi:hypothetical protein
MNDQTHHHANAQSVRPIPSRPIRCAACRWMPSHLHRYTFQGREFKFCSEHCRERFMAAPMQYIKKADTELRRKRRRCPRTIIPVM